ncbi:MAG: 3-phosphoshikimate 1-carboxyvinyltransferase [Lachnospiraceae bacterium]
MFISPAIKPLCGTIRVPGDKSISHRAIMFGALSKGDTTISNFLMADDCLSTIRCFRQMGLDIEVSDELVTVHGKGLYGLSKPTERLYTGNSGTTTRLISGILAAQDFDCELTGDESIEKRPMKRIITPLSQMGADIRSLKMNDCAPLLINGQALHGIHYHSPIASAQVKSAILLAGLYADGITKVTEPALSRNHTELMLKKFGCNISSEGTTCTLVPGNEMTGCDIIVPSDISSAAFFLAAGLLCKDAHIIIENVGVNPTRAGILDVIRAMGGNIRLLNKKESGGEPVADLEVSYSKLHGTTIEGDIIPTLIDEIPILAVMASFAEGKTVIKDAEDLHYKESDRIQVMCNHLNAIGGKATPTQDGMIIDGQISLTGGTIDSATDHRIAMSFAIAALNTKEGIQIERSDCIRISYPDFFHTLESLMQK